MVRVYILLLLGFFVNQSFGQTAGDFRSFQTGPWSDVSTWERFDGGSWVNPAPNAPSNTDGAIAVRNGHTITLTSNVSVDQLTINTGGILLVNAGVNLTVVNGTGNDITFQTGFGTRRIDVSGRIVIEEGVVIANANASTLRILNGGFYRHNYTTSPGTIATANWQAGSTLEITGYTTNTLAPSGLGQTFHNVIWNCTNFADFFIDLDGGLTTVNGNLEVQSTNGSYLVFSQVNNYTLSVAQDFNVTGNSLVAFNGFGGVIASNVNIGGNFIYNSSSTDESWFSIDGSLNMDVAGSFSCGASGTIDLVNANGGGTGSTIISIGDDFIINGSIINSLGTTNCTLTFDGNTNFSGSGSISGIVNFDIQGIANLGTVNLTGGGTLNLGASATLQVGSTHASGAIQNSTSAGNIQVSGTRTYNAGSTIVYNGLSAQFTGNGLASASNSNITIANTTGVTLSGALTIATSRTLTITAASILTIGANTLTINGDINSSGGTGFLAGSSTSNLTIGGTGAMSDFIAFSLDATAVLNQFNLNRSGGTVFMRSNLTTNGAFTHTDGTLEILGFALRINGDYNFTGGNFTTNSNTPLFIGGAGNLDPISFSTGSALAGLELDRSGSTFVLGSDITIASELRLFSGTLNNSGATLTLAENLQLRRRAGSLTAAPTAATFYNVIYNNSGALTSGPELPTGATQLGTLSKQNTGVLNLNADVTINGDFNIEGTGFTAGTHIITMNGGQILSGATASLTSSTFIFPNTTTLLGGLSPISPTFGNITITSTGTLTPILPYGINGNLVNNGTLGPESVTFGGTTAVTGSGSCSFSNLTISSVGTLTASLGTMNVAGNFTNNGIFIRNGGTILFNGVTNISGTSSTTFGGITITGTLNSPSTLSLTRHFTNNGTFVHNSGTVAFIGTAQQLIQGSSLTTFYNMTVNNPGGPPSVSVQVNTNLERVLTLQGTTIFDADGSSNTAVFTLLSTDDAPPTDAAIATIPATASFIGNVTYQRYMSIEGGNNTRIYRYISSPVSGATVADLQGEIPVTGTFTGASSCSGCGTNQSMWTYNESVLGNLDQGYENFPVTINTETFQPSRGYILFVRGNILGTPTWNLRGPINSGIINFGINFTSTGNLADDGWNLVGNPYPSTIDWDNPDWTKSNISNVIYMRDNGRGTIATYNGTIGVNNGTNLIASGQGFWVQANAAAPSLIATENVKAAGATDPDFEFFRKEAPQDLIRISLVQGNKVDETVIHFRKDALEGADRVDAWKLLNENVFNVSTVNNEGRKLAINSLPSLDCSRQIPISITEVKPGNYQFRFTELESFNNNPNIKLIDNFTNTTFDVGSGNPYSFAVTTNEFSYSSERFSLVITLPDFDQDFAFTATDVCEEANALISIQDSKKDALYTLYIGEEVVSDELHGNGGMLSLEVSKEKLALGENEITIRSVSSYCSSTKLDKVAMLHVAHKPAIQSAVVNSACLTGPVSIEVSGSPSGLYNWYRSENSTEPIAEQNGNIFVTEELNKSKTYFVATVNELGCEGERKSVLAEVVQYDPTEITLDELTGALNSSSPTNNQWYVNGELLDGQIAQQIVPELSGTYRLEVTHGAGCISVDEFDFVITGNEELLTERILVYPVPVSDILTVKIPTSIEVEKINVHNNLGQIVGEIQLSNKNGINTGEYDMRLTPSGLYSLSVYLKSGHITQFKVLRK